MVTVYDRTIRLIGRKAVDLLRQKKVLVAGIGGVGGIAAEALVRAGIGVTGIADYDRVDVTNINRQIIALGSTVGKLKVDVMKERLADINPATRVITFPKKISNDTIGEIFEYPWDYIVDAIDDISAKILLVEESEKRGIPIVSSMGTANHLDPARLRIVNISETHTCPLARRIRKEAVRRGMGDFKVLFSSEKPEAAAEREGDSEQASIIFVPAVAGLLIAYEVVKEFI